MSSKDERFENCKRKLDEKFEQLKGAHILQLRQDEIKKILPDWDVKNQFFDLRLCPDCHTLQTVKGIVFKEGTRCQNLECETELIYYTGRGKHNGELMWWNENWD